jgi:hypothetical protein
MTINPLILRIARHLQDLLPLSMLEKIIPHQFLQHLLHAILRGRSSSNIEIPDQIVRHFHEKIRVADMHTKLNAMCQIVIPIFVDHLDTWEHTNNNHDLPVNIQIALELLALIEFGDPSKVNRQYTFDAKHKQIVEQILAHTGEFTHTFSEPGEGKTSVTIKASSSTIDFDALTMFMCEPQNQLSDTRVTDNVEHIKQIQRRMNNLVSFALGDLQDQVVTDTVKQINQDIETYLQTHTWSLYLKSETMDILKRWIDDAQSTMEICLLFHAYRFIFHDNNLFDISYLPQFLQDDLHMKRDMRDAMTKGLLRASTTGFDKVNFSQYGKIMLDIADFERKDPRSPSEFAELERKDPRSPSELEDDERKFF